VTGHRGPRQPARCGYCPERGGAARTPGAGDAFPAEVQARRPAIRMGSARLPADLATGRAALQELPVTSRALAGPSPGRMTTPANEASGSVNRWLRFLARAIRPHDRAHDRGRCPLYVRAQLDTVGLSWTQRDLVRLKATARETGKTQLTGYFRRWWQVLCLGVGFEPT
jgi:hypothetical protein